MITKIFLDEFYSSITESLKLSASNLVKQNKFAQSTHVPGWNVYVKEYHDVARDAFLLWCNYNKPRAGPIFDQMKRTRARFNMS